MSIFFIQRVYKMSLNILSFLIIFFLFSFIVFPAYLKPGLNINNYSRGYYIFAFIMFYAFFISLYVFRKLFFGYDSFSYVSVLKNIMSCSSYQEISERHIARGWERGFVWLLYLISRISSNKFFFLFVIGAWLYFSFLKFFFLQKKEFLTAIMVFILLGTFFATTNLMRQMFAASIILYGYRFFIKKKYILYFVLVCVASFFHISALCCIILPIINCFKLTRKNIFFYIVGLFIIVLLGHKFLALAVHFVAPQYEVYLTSSIYGLQRKAKLGPLLNLMVQLLMFHFFYLNYEKKNETKSRLLKIYMIGLLFTAASTKFTQIGRIASYFTPTAFMLFYDTKKNKHYYLTLLTLFGYCLIVNLFRPEWTGFFPYYFDF